MAQPLVGPAGPARADRLREPLPRRPAVDGARGRGRAPGWRQPLRDAGVAGSAGAGGYGPHDGRCRTGASRAERRAARGPCRVGQPRVHGARRAVVPGGQGLPEARRRTWRRRTPRPAGGGGAGREGREQRTDAVPSERQRHGRARHPSPGEGQYARGRDARAREDAPAARQLACRHAAGPELRRLGLHCRSHRPGVEDADGDGARRRARDLRVPRLGARDARARRDGAGVAGRDLLRALRARLLDQPADAPGDGAGDRARRRRRDRRAREHRASHARRRAAPQGGVPGCTPGRLRGRRHDGGPRRGLRADLAARRATLGGSSRSSPSRSRRRC